MRDKYYADNRDIVKWGSALCLARRIKASVIVQVAFYRPDGNQRGLTVSDYAEPQPIAREVIAHFRDLNHIHGLGPGAGLRIEPIMREWTQARDQYVADIIEEIRTYRSPRVILLDPDTGIAPPRLTLKHVTSDEIQRIYNALEPGDSLAVYQHRWRDLRWLDIAKERLARAIKLDPGRILVMSCPAMAQDVAILGVIVNRE